jgi:hypothetical protein
VQGTDSGPRERGNESAGGANSSMPRSVILNFLLGSGSDSYLSRSLAVQGLEITFTEKRPAHSGPMGGLARGLEMTTT